jgi:hypothetical protein
MNHKIIVEYYGPMLIVLSLYGERITRECDIKNTNCLLPLITKYSNNFTKATDN